jgi:hypothetical protein
VAEGDRNQRRRLLCRASHPDFLMLVQAIPYPATSVSPHVLFASGERGGWWDPSDRSTLWQDQGGTIPVNAPGDPVGRIDDKSGNAVHLVQAAAAQRPTYQIDSNGRPYLLLDGIDDALIASYSFSFPFDRVSAIRQLAWKVGSHVFGGGFSPPRLVQRVASPTLTINDGITDVVNNSSLPLDVNGVVTERHVANAQKLAINNGSYVSGDAGASISGTQLIVGAYGSSGSNPMKMRFYGAVVRQGSLTDLEISQVRSWLASRAGVAL